MLIKKNQKYGIRSSGVQFIFSGLLAITSYLHYRSDQRLSNQRSSNIFQNTLITFPVSSIIFITNCFTDLKPKISLILKTGTVSPEISAHFISKLTHFWVSNLLQLGIRKNVQLSDLYDTLPENVTDKVADRFEKQWNSLGLEHKGRRSDKEFKSIIPAIVQTFGLEYAFATIIRLYFEIFNFALPFLLNQLITFAESNDPFWQGILFAFGIFAVTVNQNISNSQFYVYTYVTGNRIRVALMAAIYKKLLKLSNSAKQNKTIGEIINIMSSDTNRFISISMNIHKLWSCPFAFVVSVYYLWQYLGSSALAGLAIMVAFVPVNGYFSKKIGQIERQQLRLKDERVKQMNEILNGIKVLKLNAWEESFRKNLQNIRNEELEVMKSKATIYATILFLWTIAPFFVAFATFASLVLSSENNVLDAKTAFISIHLFNVLRDPISKFPQVIMSVLELKVSIVRINQFLNAEEINLDNYSYNSSGEFMFYIFIIHIYV